MTVLHQSALAVSVAIGLMFGFAIGMHALPNLNIFVSRHTIDKDIRFDRYRNEGVLLGRDWDETGGTTVWMKGSKSSLILGFDGPAAGYVELLVEAAVKPPSENLNVIVHYNGSEIGRWNLSSKSLELRRRFFVPRDVFNRSTAGELSFQILDKGASVSLGIEHIAMRDVEHLAGVRGFLDHCSRDRLFGWAIARGTPTAVTATVDGRPMEAVVTNVERPDLQAHGLPVDAGFEIVPTEPIKAGSTVQVGFPDGSQLRRSPCRL